MMGLFDKVAQKATNLGKNVMNSTIDLGASVVTVAQEQNELVQLKSQVNVVEQELNALYVQVGRRYINHVLETGVMPGIDVNDLLKLLDPKMTKKLELEQKIVELEKEIKAKQIAREKQMAENEFIAEKGKLERALAMGVLTQEEYDIKLTMAKKKVDNFEEIRRVKQQADMGIITREERDAKLKELME